jgi:DNA polymerase-3 subunit delta
MPKTDWKKIAGEAKRGRFAPVYFFHGEEAFLTRQAVESIISLAVDKAAADFNFDIFHGADLNIEKLSTVLSTPPMMALRRVVLVRDVERLAARDKELLADYAEKPVKSTVLILAAGERIRIDARKKSPKWASRLEEASASVIFWPLKETELIRWIITRAENLGKKIETQAAYELYARFGQSLVRLADELEKLAVFSGKREEISSEDVSFLTGIDRGGTVFDWVDALASGKILRACSLAAYLTGHGESAVGAVSIAASHFMTMARIKEMLGSRMTEQAIRGELSLGQRPAEAVSLLFTQARSYTTAQIKRMIELLLDTDLKLKKSSLPDRLILEDLAFRARQEVFS